MAARKRWKSCAPHRCHTKCVLRCWTFYRLNSQYSHCSLNYTNFCESAPVHEDGCSGDQLRHIDSRSDLELPCYRRSQCRVVLEGRPCAKVSGLSRLSLMLSTFRKQGRVLFPSFAKVCCNLRGAVRNRYKACAPQACWQRAVGCRRRDENHLRQRMGTRLWLVG